MQQREKSERRHLVTDDYKSMAMLYQVCQKRGPIAIISDKFFCKYFLFN